MARFKKKEKKAGARARVPLFSLERRKPRAPNSVSLKSIPYGELEKNGLRKDKDLFEKD
jgi:hypothetical protein